MANLIPYNTVNIIINIPDLIINDTIIKRKAVLFTMTYNQDSKYLALTWIVKSFSNNNGEYGESLESVIPDYSHNSIADNTIFVNPQTGEILPPIITPITDSQTGYITYNVDYSVDYMSQYDWFNMIAESQPIQVHTMIRQYGSTVINWNK